MPIIHEHLTFPSNETLRRIRRFLAGTCGASPEERMPGIEVAKIESALNRGLEAANPAVCILRPICFFLRV